MVRPLQFRSNLSLLCKSPLPMKIWTNGPKIWNPVPDTNSSTTFICPILLVSSLARDTGCHREVTTLGPAFSPFSLLPIFTPQGLIAFPTYAIWSCFEAAVIKIRQHSNIFLMCCVNSGRLGGVRIHTVDHYGHVPGPQRTIFLPQPPGAPGGGREMWENTKICL